MTESLSKVTETRFGPPQTEPPLVSVLMITYNHERFIREALESVFMQQVDFPIEVVIGEDCSTDRTRAVIEDVCQQAPFPVRLLTSARNVGMQANFRRAYESCRGEFIAMLEGDDWWLDSHKIARQSRFLREHSEVPLVAHRARVIFDDGATDALRQSWPHEVPVLEQGYLDFEKVSTFGFMIPTASLMFRRERLGRLPDWLAQLPMADWFITVSLSLRNPIYIDQRVDSAYRIHQGGVFSARLSDDRRLWSAGQLELLRFLFDGTRDVRARKRIFEALSSRLFVEAHLLELAGQVTAARQRVADQIRLAFRAGKWPSARALKWWLRLRCPGPYASVQQLVRKRREESRA